MVWFTTLFNGQTLVVITGRQLSFGASEEALQKPEDIFVSFIPKESKGLKLKNEAISVS